MAQPNASHPKKSTALRGCERLALSYSELNVGCSNRGSSK
jgi:hypothetical protein